MEGWSIGRLKTLDMPPLNCPLRRHPDFHRRALEFSRLSSALDFNMVGGLRSFHFTSQVGLGSNEF